MPAILAYFATAIGRQVLTYGVAALVAGGVILGIRQSGYNAAMRKCEARALQLKLDAQALDLKAAQDAAASADRELSDSNSRLADSEKRISDYERSLANKTACLLTDDDVADRRVREPGHRGRAR